MEGLRRSLCCSGINKPVAVMDWLEKVQPQEEYILILDADMIMLKPFDPVKMGVLPGLPCVACASHAQLHTATPGFAIAHHLPLKHMATLPLQES